MKRDPFYTYLCAAVISLCIGLGSIGSMVTGLTLPVKLGALVILCLLLALSIAGIGLLRHSGLVFGIIGIIFLLSPDLLLQFKTVAAAVALRLELAYSIPIPEILQGEDTEQLLPALCFLAGIIMVSTTWAIQKQKTAIPAALLSLIPLACCITVTDSVPDAPWLFLWGVGLVLLLLPQGVRLQSIPRGNQLTALLLIPTVLFFSLLFWLVPRNGTDRWSVAQLPQQVLNYFANTFGPGTGSTLSAPEEVNLSALAKRWEDPTAVMDITADFTGPVYLRGRDYDQYTGTSWICTPGRTEKLYGFSQTFHEKDGTVEIETIKSLDYYYVPAITQQVQLISDGQSPNPNAEKQYRFEHCSLRSDWHIDWEDPGVSTVNPRYLELNADTLAGALTYLNEQKALGTLDLSDSPVPVVAEQISLLLRKHVPYDLSTPNMPLTQTDLALWFLNDATTGYCVHYATTAVVLLRACGIPARYVEGYTVNAEAGETVTVRQQNAHAWAEYYVNGVGWLVLEATASGNTVPEEPVTTVPTQTQPAATDPSATTTAPSESSETSTTSPATTVPTAPGTESTETHTNPAQTGKEPPRRIAPLLQILLGALISLVLLWGQYRLRRYRFGQAIRRSTPNRRALVIHHRLCRLSKWTKQPVPTELTQLAQKARFSNHTLTAPELARLLGSLRLAEATVSHLPIPKRLIAKWLFARY